MMRRLQLAIGRAVGSIGLHFSMFVALMALAHVAKWSGATGLAHGLIGAAGGFLLSGIHELKNEYNRADQQPHASITAPEKSDEPEKPASPRTGYYSPKYSESGEELGFRSPGSTCAATNAVKHVRAGQFR